MYTKKKKITSDPENNVSSCIAIYLFQKHSQISIYMQEFKLLTLRLWLLQESIFSLKGLESRVLHLLDSVADYT